MERLLALVRKPQEIVAIVSKRSRELTIAPEALAQTPFHDEANPLYAFAEIPLASVSPALVPRRERLQASWEALCAVRSPDADTLFHVLVVLLETVAGVSEDSDLPPLSLPHPDEVKPPPPTAAHPRAFKGTKYKPPKPKPPPVTDLRPYLCNPRTLQQVLTRLEPHWAAAVTRLEQQGYATQALRTRQVGGDPYLTVHHAGESVESPFRLPWPFRGYLLPSLRDLPWTLAAEYLSAYHHLGLESRPGLLVAVARLISLQNDRRALHWLRLLLQQPEAFRAAFATLLVETQAYACDPAALSEEEATSFLALIDGPFYAYRLYGLFNALRKGVSLDYMMAGYRLANAHYPECKFYKIERSGVFPQEAVERLAAHLRKDAEYWERFVLSLWEACGKWEGMSDILLMIPWERYAPPVAFRYLWLYTHFENTDLPPEVNTAKWHFMRKQAGRIESLVANVAPEYQRKCVAFLKQCFWFWDKISELEAKIPLAYTLLERLAQPPFKKEGNTDFVLCRFLDCLTQEEQEGFLSAPDTSFRRLETACRRKNDADLIAEGIGSLARIVKAFALRWFVEEPNRLFKVARLLGVFPDAMRDEIARAFSQEPQEAQTSPAQLAALERQAWRALESDFPVEAEEDAVRHALQMHRFTKDNRRPFRKFLRAYWNGRRDYILTHPRTVAWLQAHPDLNQAAWLQGVSYVQEVEGQGILRIEREQEPLETLKMGTYVGSCLGLGGSFAYSAIAAVLDFNKLVLYARNARGKVIARQLVAISEAEELVCFAVYPYTIAAAVKQMFREADEALAQSLGIPLYDVASPQDYAIANILSQDWWDDGAWNFDTE